MTDTLESTETSEPETTAHGPQRPWAVVARVAAAIAVPVLAFVAISASLDVLSDQRANRLLIAGLAIVLGVGGVFALFWAADTLVDWLPGSLRESVRPYVFVGPALVVLAVFLIYPLISTVLITG